MFYTPHVEIPANAGSRWLAFAVAMVALLALKLNRHRPADRLAPVSSGQLPKAPRRIRGDSQELRA